MEEKNKELAVVEERNRIARELHDSVSQSPLRDQPEPQYPGTDPREPNRQKQALIGQVKEMVEEAQREMRLMISWIATPVLRRELNHRTQLALYRVVQEALHNIVKHARATKAQVSPHDSRGGSGGQDRR